MTKPSATDVLADLRLAALVAATSAEDQARVRRIAEEAAATFAAMARVRKGVTIFGSARAAPVTRWGALAHRVSWALADAGFTVITGGGPGLMAAANQGAQDAGAASVGLTIELPHDEPANAFLSLRVPFHYFFLRKLALVRYSCAFVLLPGGFGTLDELFEALNLRHTRRLESFPVILVGTEYWQGLVDWLRRVAIPAGSLAPEDVDGITITDDPGTVVTEVTRCHATLCRTLGIAQ
ncbi:TIGR00730 family Rossman fold protein [Pseudogemmatithrix spongiicola]|uniref:Cytokinin riboside 5'-monophosphate phosphoribohydrolase n=1 Tax=Pseudogemmatithrix spongiicola TaxID=3062599 RepID=A0AA49JY72_9BACT|nr:TIGR00730 family Rossman fold protein [Gemmatimonadaceae bacterium 'strain 138']WKW14191.1 TIGR00730 family Rossman fold protein [Gemmatimonadaceae bacterium 'strain 318']